MEGQPPAVVGTEGSPEPPGGFPPPHVTLGAALAHTRELDLGFPAGPGRHSVLSELLKKAGGHPGDTATHVPSLQGLPGVGCRVYHLCHLHCHCLPRSGAPQGRRAHNPQEPDREASNRQVLGSNTITHCMVLGFFLI